MGRLILRYAGAQSMPEADLQKILAVPGLQVVDRSTRMLLVEGDVSVVRERLDAMDGWSANAEQSVPLPDVRKRLK